MVGDLMVALWSGVTDFAEMIFDLFSKVGAIPFIVAFTIIGIFISFIILKRGEVSFRGSDTVLPAGTVEQSQRYRQSMQYELHAKDVIINNGM